MPKNRLSGKDELVIKEAEKEIEEQNQKLKIVENIETNIGKGPCWIGKSKRNNEFIDVTLVCQDGKHIEGHKTILVGSCAAFKSLINTHEHAHPSLLTTSLQSLRKEKTR